MFVSPKLDAGVEGAGVGVLRTCDRVMDSVMDIGLETLRGSFLRGEGVSRRVNFGVFLSGEEKTCLRFATTSEKVLEGIGGEPQTDTVCLGENDKERGEGREGVFTAAFAFDIFCGEPGGDRAGLPVEPRPAGRRGGAQACISLVRVRSVEGGTEHEGGAEVLEDEGLVAGRRTRGDIREYKKEGAGSHPQPGRNALKAQLAPPLRREYC